MPTKLFDGLTELFHVSKATAIPWIPENPRPPPLLPRAVAWVTLASARVKVIPSAPLPDPMNMSKDAEMPTPVTALGQKAEPTSQLVAGVSCRLGGDVVVLTTALPFSCQPPATGEGIVPGGGPAPYVN